MTTATEDCYAKPDPCVTCMPPQQATCKVCLYMDAFKYDGRCYTSCHTCGCPKIIIEMRRVDALKFVKTGRARFIDEENEEFECTPPGGCCEKQLLM